MCVNEIPIVFGISTARRRTRINMRTSQKATLLLPNRNPSTPWDGFRVTPHPYLFHHKDVDSKHTTRARALAVCAGRRLFVNRAQRVKQIHKCPTAHARGGGREDTRSYPIIRKRRRIHLSLIRGPIFRTKALLQPDVD